VGTGGGVGLGVEVPPLWALFANETPCGTPPSRSSWGEVGWRERRRAPSPQGGRGVGRHYGPPSGEGGIVVSAMANLGLELGVVDFRLLDALEGALEDLIGTRRPVGGAALKEPWKAFEEVFPRGTPAASRRPRRATVGTRIDGGGEVFPREGALDTENELVGSSSATESHP
jgi:hypothetical protein